VGGLVGVYCGGELAARYATHNERLQLKMMALLYCGYGVVSACIYLSPSFSPSPYLPLGLMAVGVFAVSTVSGPLFAIIQTVVPDRIRAMSVAVIFLFANLIGMGLGPLAAGALSDALRPSLGEESLRYALLMISPGYLWGAWHLWRGSATVTRDLELVQYVRTEKPDRTSSGELRLSSTD
jgi:MFS transporter, Spinster family, sphingosine-1-phosphate transporter